MKYFDWDKAKNKQLLEQREVSFEEIVDILYEHNALAVIPYHNPKKYPHQKIYIVNIDNYAYLVPFVEDDEKIFLKTIIPSRQATKKYILKK